MDFPLRRTRLGENVVLDLPKLLSQKRRTRQKRKRDELEQEHQQPQPQEEVEEDHHLVTFPPPPAKSEEHQQLVSEEEPQKEEEGHQLLSYPPAKLEEQQLQEEEEPQEKEEEPQEKEEEEDYHSVTRPPAKSEEHQQPQEEDHHPVTLPPGHVIEAEVAANGGAEMIDICSSPEETKPKVDHLLWLQPVSKPNYHVKVPRESLEKFIEVAVVLKSASVSHLKKSARKLDIADMVKAGNECFTRLRTLEVDYQAFHGEVYRRIEYCQKLKEANEGKNLGLKEAYENSVIDANDAKDKLHRAENDLFSAQTLHNLRRRKIKDLREMLGILEAEEPMERNRLATLTAEKNRCHEAHSRSKNKVDRLSSELDGIIKKQYMMLLKKKSGGHLVG